MGIPFGKTRLNHSTLLIILLVAGTGLCCFNFYSSLFLPPPVPAAQNGLLLQIKKARTKPAGAPWPSDGSHTVQMQMRSTQLTNKACNGYQGIYHIAMTDILGGVGTSLIQLVLGQLMYAEANNLKPWVYLNNQSQVFYDPVLHGARGTGAYVTAMVGRNATYVSPSRESYRIRRDFVPGPPNSYLPVTKQTMFFEGTGVWEHYFEPVSDFVPGDLSCESKLYVTMDLYLITPGIHGFSRQYATRSWRYDYLPDYITQPHVPLNEWLLPQRQRAHKVISKYIRFKTYLHDLAARLNPNCSLPSNPCLGLHIRHSDKAAGRRQIDVQEFLPYALAFVQQGGKHIYLATDSNLVFSEISETWPLEVRSRIRPRRDQVIRSNNNSAVFDIASHDRTNREALVEILALSQCQFLIHGLSALSESSIWINLDLHYRSVNLEDVDHLDELAFAKLVGMAMESPSELDTLPRPPQTDNWWNKLIPGPDQSRATYKDNIERCDGYTGILHISNVAKDAGIGLAFFGSILNQFLLASQLNLLPWVRLSCSSSWVLEDPSSQLEQNTTFHASGYSELRFFNGKWELPTDNVGTSRKSFQIRGCNTWDLYYESHPIGNDVSCASKPVFFLNQEQISKELGTQTPGMVHAWRRDDLTKAAWNPDLSSVESKAAMWSMRQKGHEVMTKYYHVRSPIRQRAELVNPVKLGEVCMAVHIRATDKMGRHRKKVTAEKYVPYIESYLKAGGKWIYVATDSSRALRFLSNSLPETLKRFTRSQGKYVVRSNSRNIPPFALDSHHRVNSETLVDIYAMSKCQILLHSFSTVAEVVIYLNPTLHNRSVNLEDSHRMDATRFEQFAASVVNQNK